MDGIADMGGTAGWGRVDPPRADEPVFPERWHGRAFALALLANRLAGGNLDTFRYALERLGRRAYFDEGYFGRWLNGAELVLDENAVLTRDATWARARNLAGEQVEEPPVPPGRETREADSVVDSVRQIDATPAFTVGDDVRTKDLSPAGHSRLARYARGHAGVVKRVQPAFVFPDTNAEHQGENPQYVYTVRFDSRELFGHDAESFAVTIDLFESYLEKAA